MAYTDGACSGNPGPGGWAAILISALGQVIELGGFEPQTTNNRMELTAALNALKALERNPVPLVIRTDSTYVIKGITEWVHGWKKKGWITSQNAPVSNSDLWQDLDDIASSYATRAKLEWRHVRGHSGDAGNDRADLIAVGYSKQKPPELFAGLLADYPVLLGDPKGPAWPKSARQWKFPLYISFVEGQLYRHKTWTECEARVRGQSGARFRKAKNLEELDSILCDWKLSRDLLVDPTLLC